MRSKWILSCAVLLAISSAVFAQPQDLTGTEILENSAKAYARLDRYVGTSSVISRITVQASETQTFDATQTTNAKIEFNRSVEGQVARVESLDKKSRSTRKPLEFSADAGKIKIEGIGIYGKRYSLIGDGKTATVTLVGFDDKEKIDKDLEINLAVATFTGSSSGAATIVPTALLGIRYGNPLESLKAPHLQGVETIGLWDCYRVTDFDAVMNIKTTYWIDRKSFLMRQYQTERGEMNLEAEQNKRRREMLEETQQYMKKSGLKSIMTLQLIGIEEAR